MIVYLLRIWMVLFVQYLAPEGHRDKFKGTLTTRVKNSLQLDRLMKMSEQVRSKYLQSLLSDVKKYGDNRRKKTRNKKKTLERRHYFYKKENKFISIWHVQ